MAGNVPFYQNQNGMPIGTNYQPQGWQNPYNNPYTMVQQQSQNQPPRLPYDNQQQSSPVQSYISGRMVSSNEEIKPNEVLMDGSISLFPMNDYSAIYAKQWDANGLIQTVKYIPEQPMQKPESGQNDILSIINQKLDNIEKKLNQKPYYKKPYNKHKSYSQDQNVESNSNMEEEP